VDAVAEAAVRLHDGLGPAACSGARVVSFDVAGCAVRTTSSLQ
jgi:hypothetical protein